MKYDKFKNCKKDDKIINKQNSENILHGTYRENDNQLTETELTPSDKRRSFVEKNRASHKETQSAFIKVFFSFNILIYLTSTIGITKISE